MRYGIFARNSKMDTTYRVFVGQDFTRKEAAKFAVRLDMACKPHLSYFAMWVRNETKDAGAK